METSNHFKTGTKRKAKRVVIKTIQMQWIHKK